LLHQQNFQYHQDKIIIMSGILDFFADNKEVTQLIAKSVPAIMGMHQASKAKNAAEGYQIKLDNIEKNRQEIVNPYANVTNPFANMQVATQAAEMQAEQTDIALANTLDTLRSTGAAAGGATALAQAALKSKQGISADIEKQEMANQKLMAQGEQQMQQLQGAGKSAQMNMQENRDLRDITRLQDNMNLAQQQRAAGQATAGMAMASGIAGMAGLIDPEAKNVDDAAATTGAGTDYDGDGVSTMNFSQGDFSVTPGDFGLGGGGGSGMLINPILQNAVDPKSTALNYTGSWSDISTDVNLVKSGGDTDGSAQKRINEWYKLKGK
jgi:hypothetical protein